MTQTLPATTVWLALFCLLLTACAGPAPALTPTPTCGNAMTPLTYLALGDSYTIGESVPETERWPNQLSARLRAQGVPLSDPLIIARTGWTTDELDSAITRANPPATFDLVSLLIGVNNQYRGRSAEAYRAEFRALLERAIGFAGGRAGRVLVLSIPDWGVTQFATGLDRAKIAADIDAFNAVNAEESARAGVAYVDVTPISRRAFNESGWIAPDNLHPSGQMYTAWVDVAAPVACALLAKP